MTREEAIKHLSLYVGNDCYTDRMKTACKMAIAALMEQDDHFREATKMGCSACDGGFGDNTMVFYAGGYKHCPMCGRRLEEV